MQNQNLCEKRSDGQALGVKTMELFSPKLIDKGKLAALTQVYLKLRLPLHAARNAAGADLANLVMIPEETVSISERFSRRHSVSPKRGA